jgi:putative nucleotidyltransferase with HDIG domain
MSLQNVVILTDRLDRARALVEAARPITRCRMAGVADDWIELDHVSGVIADVSLERTDTRRCLAALSSGLDGRPLPMAYVMQTMRDGELRQAEKLGATACFPPHAPPRTVVTGLFRQIAPKKTMTDLLVEHSFDRAELLFTDMFRAARLGRIDLGQTDDEIDPVLRALKEGGLQRWLDLVQAHDDQTVRHCLLVAGLAAHFALHLGLSIDDRTSFVRAALVHDVGKAMIPLEILQKPGPLDADELMTMRRHSDLGHGILIASKMTDTLALSVTRHHHEMLDGSGYPDGLSGAGIPDPVRLLTICDIYAALTEDRPYRPAMSQEIALAILKSMTPTKLESDLVVEFSKSLSPN